MPDTKNLVPYQSPGTSRKSSEITRSYLRRGQSISRSLWLEVAPKNPLLKAIVAVPIMATALLLFFILLLILGFTLLAIVVMQVICRVREKDTGKS